MGVTAGLASAFLTFKLSYEFAKRFSDDPVGMQFSGIIFGLGATMPITVVHTILPQVIVSNLGTVAKIN